MNTKAQANSLISFIIKNWPIILLLLFIFLLAYLFGK